MSGGLPDVRNTVPGGLPDVRNTVPCEIFDDDGFVDLQPSPLFQKFEAAVIAEFKKKYAGLQQVSPSGGKAGNQASKPTTATATTTTTKGNYQSNTLNLLTIFSP